MTSEGLETEAGKSRDKCYAGNCKEKLRGRVAAGARLSHASPACHQQRSLTADTAGEANVTLEGRGCGLLLHS